MKAIMENIFKDLMDLNASIPSLAIYGLVAFAILTKLCEVLKMHPTNKNGLLGYNVTALLWAIVLSYIGWYGYLTEPILEDRLYGFSKSSDILGRVMAAYQIWNLFAGSLFEDYRTPIMIAHHVLAFAVSYSSYYPFLHGYSCLFLGITETTNIFLCLIEIFKMFPDFPCRYPKIDFATNIFFVVFFYIIRGGWWSYASIFFWSDLLALLNSGRAHDEAVVYLQLTSHFFLSVMQILWGWKIIFIVKGALAGDTPSQVTKKSQ